MKSKKRLVKQKIVKPNYQKILVVSGLAVLIIGVLWGVVSKQSSMVAQPADIFVIDSSMQYGHTTLTGVIRSDITSDGSGNYYLVLDNDRVVGIDKTNSLILKKLEGKRVEITGELVEIPDLGIVGIMLPSNIIEKA